MLVGYARVSTQEQNLDRQIEALEAQGCEKIFTDKASGKNTERKAFKEMLDYLRADDTLIVASLDRLGRDYKDMSNTLRLINDKGAKINVLDAPFLNFNTGNDTLDMALFDMLIPMLNYIADQERKKILERQAQGIAIAKRKGVYKGKPKEYSAEAKDKGKRAIYHNIVADLSTDKSIKSIADAYGVTRNVVYRIKKELQ